MQRLCNEHNFQSSHSRCIQNFSLKNCLIFSDFGKKLAKSQSTVNLPRYLCHSCRSFGRYRWLANSLNCHFHFINMPLFESILCHPISRNRWAHLYHRFFKKMCANPGLFLFIFILFKHKFYRKTVGFNGIRTRIVRLVGQHADHLTTTMGQIYKHVWYKEVQQIIRRWFQCGALLRAISLPTTRLQFLWHHLLIF